MIQIKVICFVTLRVTNLFTLRVNILAFYWCIQEIFMSIYYVPSLQNLRSCSQEVCNLIMRETTTKYDKIMYKKYNGAERKKCLNLPKGGRKNFKKEIVLGGRSNEGEDLLSRGKACTKYCAKRLVWKKIQENTVMFNWSLGAGNDGKLFHNISFIRKNLITEIMVRFYESNRKSTIFYLPVVIQVTVQFLNMPTIKMELWIRRAISGEKHVYLQILFQLLRLSNVNTCDCLGNKLIVWPNAWASRI